MVEMGLVLAAVVTALGPQSLANALVEPTLIVMLTGGLVGMSIRSMLGSFLDEDETESDDMGGDDLMGGDDDMDDLGGLGGDDEFGDFGGDDEFGDMGGGDAGVDELEQRIDEMENEVGTLSSTVNTVRSENEEISQKVDDVQENVRKLLDIYEMVTRGVNPFADDVGNGMGGGDMGGGSFGLFDDSGADDQEEEEELDEDIAAADAEGFFDESLVGDEDEESVDDMFDEEPDDPMDDDGGTFEDDLDDDTGMDDMEQDDSGDGSSKSFQELKDEYESGDADWAEGDDERPMDEEPDEDLPMEDDQPDADEALTEEAPPAEDPLFEEESGDEADDILDDATFEADTPEANAADGGVEAVEMDDAPEADPAAANGHDPAPEPEPEPTAHEGTESTTADEEATAADSEGGKPYLATLPSGFGAELVLVEWLDFLVDRSDPRRAAQAIEYYERIDWISEPVAAHMQDVLVGFDGNSSEDASLTIDDHTRSLRYISELTESTADTVALDLLERGGVMDGIQR